MALPKLRLTVNLWHPELKSLYGLLCKLSSFETLFLEIDFKYGEVTPDM